MLTSSTSEITSKVNLWRMMAVRVREKEWEGQMNINYKWKLKMKPR